jgi:hypothetical protein
MDEHPQRDPNFMTTLRRLLELGREQSERVGETENQAASSADASSRKEQAQASSRQ